MKCLCCECVGGGGEGVGSGKESVETCIQVEANLLEIHETVKPGHH